MNKSWQKIISMILMVGGLSTMILTISFGLYGCDIAQHTSAETAEITTEVESIVPSTETELIIETTVAVSVETEAEPEIETEAETVLEPTIQYFDVPLSEDLQELILALCETYNLEPTIVLAVIYRESTYRPHLIGDNGEAFGLMQVQPKWHQGRMDRLGVTDLLDPYQNVKVGIDYLGELASTGNSIEWALMAYNGGPDYADYKASCGVVTAYATQVIAHSKTITTKS